MSVPKSAYFKEKSKDRAVQFNARLHESVIGMVNAGCAQTGLSQGRFVEMCIIKQSARIPELLAQLNEAALKIITDEMLGRKR